MTPCNLMPPSLTIYSIEPYLQLVPAASNMVLTGAAESFSLPAPLSRFRHEAMLGHSKRRLPPGPCGLGRSFAVWCLLAFGLAQAGFGLHGHASDADDAPDAAPCAVCAFAVVELACGANPAPAPAQHTQRFASPPWLAPPEVKPRITPVRPRAPPIS